MRKPPHHPRDFVRPVVPTSAPAPPRRASLAGLAFLALLLLMLALKTYKTHHAGLIYDEAANARRYANSVHQALTAFDRPGNHILNSIFVYYARRLFPSYEHSIRIPSLLAGLIFSLASACLLWRLIASWPLRLLALPFLNLVPSVFDYSFLARGYAFALPAFLLQILCVLHCLDRPVRFRYAPLVLLILAALNFLITGLRL